MDPQWIQVRLRRDTRDKLADAGRRIHQRALDRPEEAPARLCKDSLSMDDIVSELLRRNDAHAMRAKASQQRKRKGLSVGPNGGLT